ncbi:MAG TPA: pyrroloquinoline quinone-dependent dehydrogenase [Candidatus Acidoferrales bacterium]|nr:pyrroloquinoline quinone-dependent dehydrogenase [Candidatus Acidoferrales bacterium]
MRRSRNCTRFSPIGFSIAILITLGLLWLPGTASGQASSKAGEWPTYGADLANSKYRPLDQINASNFGKLEVAWRFKTDSIGNRPEYKLEGTPLMVNGVVYATAGSRRAAIALDAATGELLWVHGEHEGARGAAAPRQLSGRGLAYWSDGKEERILYVTPGYRLIALDAKTGALIPAFGKGGAVDLKLDDDQTILPDLTTGEIGIQSAPVVAKDTILVGAAFREGMTPKSMRNNKGYVRGFDVRSGKRLWIFHTIPVKGEFGYDTWEKGSAEYTGNTGVWTQISVDEQLGLVYLPVESPTGDYYGGHRPGNNLFGESLVCVDLKTGQRKWHYQLVHHPLWDMDISSGPLLADVNVGGRAVKAVAQPTKQGFLYVLDRVTGKPVWPIDEKPVEKGNVPGEWYSPTQPFPSKPPAYARNGVSVNDLIDFTPALHDEAMTLVAKYKLGPVFTPPALSKVDGPLATLTLGTASGGTNWPGGSYDPESHTVYAYACNACVTGIGVVPAPKEISDMDYVLGTAGREVRIARGPGENAGADSPMPGREPAAAPAPTPAAGRGGAGGGGGSFVGLNIQGLPLIKPPYGTISAINLDRGEIVWQVAHGDTPDAIRNNAALKGLTIPRTGQSGYNVGTLLTKTLLIAGDGQVTTTSEHPRGAMLRAYDKASGNEVGHVWMPAPQSGSPMTYMVNGRQYIVVAVSGGPYSGEYIAFTLPQ